jgi:AraC-like DNA-binding protein
MLRRNLPAVDRSIAPRHGVSRDGQPLSWNRAPAADLAPWIARIYVAKVDAPADYVLRCGLFNDTAVLRVQLGGQWTAETADGPRQHGRAALIFGPHSRRMPISVRGSFISLGISLRPGTCHAMKGPKLADLVDRSVPFDDAGISSAALLAELDERAEPEAWALTLENFVRARVEAAGWVEPDPVTARFETIAFTDPGISIAAFARDCGVEKRTLERLVSRDFGMPPKQVLRRARALDIARHLRGVADQNEAEELALRYYDQSHLIREFTELFGMSPGQFVATPQPLLTLTLESRQSRRLEALERIGPGDLRPWE